MNRECIYILFFSVYIYLLRALEEEHGLELGLGAHLAIPAVQVVLVAREAVDEERVLAALLHRGLEQSARDLDGHNGALADVVLDLLAHLGADALTLGAQQVACRQMHIAEVLY